MAVAQKVAGVPCGIDGDVLSIPDHPLDTAVKTTMNSWLHTSIGFPMRQLSKLLLAAAPALLIVYVTVLRADTSTCHLHAEVPVPATGYHSLLTAGPDTAAVSLESPQLSNYSAVPFTATIASFATDAGVPGTAGVFPAGSTFNFSLWMKKSGNWGAMHASATLRTTSANLCTGQAANDLTTTLTLQTFSCSTASPVSITATDRLYLTVSVVLTATTNGHSTFASLYLEGVLDANYDSKVEIPALTSPPAITSLTPSSGPVGTDVTVAGSGFGATQADSVLKFNNVPVTSMQWHASSLLATVPTEATSGPVVVTVSGQDSNGVQFDIPPPSISGLSPGSGAVGIPVMIAGSGFGPSQPANQVTFNGVTASVTGWAPTSITALVPDTAVTGPIVVTVNGRASNGVVFTVPPPAITSVTPDSGPAGSQVTLLGSGFGPFQPTSAVTFNNLPGSVTGWSPTTIDATVPEGASTGPVVVTVNGRSSNGVPFTIITTGGLAGTVTRASDGSPLSGATVQLLYGGVSQGVVTTPANGTFSFEEVSPGLYDVRVSSSGLSPDLFSNVSVIVAQTTTLNVAMGAPGSVMGRITETDGVTAIAGASVTAFNESTDSGHGLTDANGQYSVGGLHAGPYTVQVVHVGHKTKEQSTSVASGTSVTVDVSLDPAPQGAVTYAYDDLNRLVSVVDPSGDSAVYTYDAVGNLLSIERNGAGTVSIATVEPAKGPVGQSVTISGSGFDPTPANNAVQFNGTAATVLSASTTTLSTSVPVGASTGSVTVTTPGGNASSPEPFTVTSDMGTPTITGFSPNLASAGETVTIDGTNFETTPATDFAFINLTGIQPTTATATQLSITVPAPVATGRISVETPAGTATTSSYLWVPPPPYVSANVETTDLMPLNTPTQLAVATAGKIALRGFEGVAGESVSFEISGRTAGLTTYSVYSPYGGLVSSTFTSNGFVDSAGLPYTGTYTFVMDPLSSQTGTATITLHHYLDQTAVMPTDGTPVSVGITEAGQSARMHFAGAAGDRFSVYVRDVTITGCQTWKLSIVAPDGKELSSVLPCGGTQSFLNTITLPAGGTYTLVFGGQGTATGTATLQAYKVADVKATVTPGDPAAVYTTTMPGQDVRLSFTAAAGQMVSALATGVTMTELIPTSCPWEFMILAPDGLTVTWNHGCLGSSSLFLDTVTLPTAGTYTVVLGGTTSGVGSGTIQLFNVVHVASSVAPDDPATSYETTVPGQDVRLSFSGASGQMVSAIATGVSMTEAIPTSCPWSSRSWPRDGSTLRWNHGCLGGTALFLDTVTLPTTGTYTVMLGGTGTGIGSATIQLFSVTNLGTTISPGDPEQSYTTTTPGQDVRLLFTASEGQKVSALATNITTTTIIPTNCEWNLQILNSSGGIVASDHTCLNGTVIFLDALTLSAGDYTLLFSGGYTAIGSATLALFDVPSDATATTTVNGTPAVVTIAVPGQNGLVTFPCSAGQSVTVQDEQQCAEPALCLPT